MKIIKVDFSEKSKQKPNQAAQIPNLTKSKLVSFRVFAILLWLVAISCEVWAILLFRSSPVNITALIILILTALITVIVGSILWKKANRLNPASSKEKLRFFIQNQLGVIICLIAFLPLVILIFKNENLDPTQKKILGSIAGVALLIAGLSSADFNSPSKEKPLEDSQQIKKLDVRKDYVYWTEFGKSYHLYSQCSYINTYRTHQIYEGTISEVKELKNIEDLCDRCEAKQKSINTEILEN